MYLPWGKTTVQIVYFQFIVEDTMRPPRGKRIHTYFMRENSWKNYIQDNIQNSWSQSWDVKMLKAFHMTLMDIIDVSWDSFLIDVFTVLSDGHICQYSTSIT